MSGPRMRRFRRSFPHAIMLLLAGCAAVEPPAPAPASRGAPLKVAAIQPKARLVPSGIGVEEALARAETSLEELCGLIERAVAEGARAVALPEDTLGLGLWEAAHPERAAELLPRACALMLQRLGRAAARHRIHVVCCNDDVGPSGRTRNVAFLIGPDGREVRRYVKVNMPLHEMDKERGRGFPVFETAELGGVGMLICYDMVFPEAARALALGGADVMFHPTLGGAAIGDADVSRAAFRTRAVENFVWIVVSQRGSGSMIISPQGKIVAEASGPDSLAIAEIDPWGGREGGDAFNRQDDMRARLFRERAPEAYGILTDPDPPALGKAPEATTVEEAVRIARAARTIGEIRFREADRLRAQGRREEAVAAYEQLRRDFPRTWIDRVSQRRLVELGSKP